MARLTLQMYYVNGTNAPPYEMTAGELRYRLVGDDFGPGLEALAIRFETDDGREVYIGVPGPPRRRGEREGELRASVEDRN